MIESSNAISKGKNIFKSFVLKSVFVDINNSIRVSNTTVYKFFDRLAGRIEYASTKVFLNSFSSIYISESGNLLAY